MYKRQHQHVTSFHLLKAFCNNKNLSIKNLLEQSELNLTNLDQSLEGFLINKPRVNGSDDIFLEGDLKKVLETSEKTAIKKGDNFVSIDLLLTVLINSPELKQFLKKLGFNFNSFENAIRYFRKDKKVTSQNAEDSFQALERFTTDSVSYTHLTLPTIGSV